MILSTGIVWKNQTRAIDEETSDTVELYRIELFVVAGRGMLNFDVIRAFPRVVLLNTSLDPKKVEIYASDKLAIPEALRQSVVDEYARALTMKNPHTGRYQYYSKYHKQWVTVYEETNNYYRAITGLPNYAASSDDYVYNTDPRWPTDVPIHEMEYIDRIEIEKEGVLAELIKANPDKEYLKYVGKRGIDIFQARIADRFEILWRNDSETASLNNDFDEVYEKSRQLTLAVYYNKAIRRANNLYDSFMAMCIMFMTVQQMQNYYLHTDITRDFYDIESLKVVYDAYSVPFYPEIPMEYHKKIVKNVNRLISVKGSAQVFFDLFNIFDLGTMNVYQYYLTKRHKVDENNKPLYRFMMDGDGNVMLDKNGRPIYDPSVYETKFSKVLIGEDVALAVSDRSNDVDYDILTRPDPYWIEDADLIMKLQKESFNYLETKYIGIQCIFDLMAITFENAYVFRMITDNKELCERMEFRWTDLGINCSLFDLFIYLASLYCRLYGYEGIITNRIPAMMDTLGYNFEHSMEILSDYVMNDPYLSTRQDIIDIMTDMDMTRVDDANRVYDNIQELRKIVMNGYQNAKTKEEFFAYKELYDTLLCSKEITEVYTNPRTGEIFDTFTDVLTNCSPDLMQRYLLTDDDKVLDEMNICIDKLEEVMTSLRYLPFSAGVNTNKMIDSLFRILKFFKSAKAELIGYDITYAITMRGINFFKMLDLIDRIFNTIWVNDQNTMLDVLELLKDLTHCRFDAFKMLDQVANDKETVWWWDYIHYLTDCIWVVHDIIETVFKSESWYLDFIQSISTTVMLKTAHLMEDFTKAEEITWDIYEPKYYDFIKDEIRFLVDHLYEGERINYCMSLLYDIDFIESIYTSYYLQKDIRFRSGITYADRVMKDEFLIHIGEDRHLFEDIYKIAKQIYIASNKQSYDDKLQGFFGSYSFDTIELKDRLVRILTIGEMFGQFKVTDLVKLVILVSTHIDAHGMVDELLGHMTSTVTDDAWFIDVLEGLKQRTKLVDCQLLDDQMKAEEIFYELFYPEFKERLDDDIQQLADKLKDVSYENGCKTQAMDLLYLIDLVAESKVTVDLSKLSGVNIHYDALKYAMVHGRPTEAMSFNEILSAIEKAVKPESKQEFIDKLTAKISGRGSSKISLEDTLVELAAIHMVEDTLDVKSFVKLIISIANIEDRADMLEILSAIANEFSDTDATTMADVMDAIIYKCGKLQDILGLEDWTKVEAVFYEELSDDVVYESKFYDRIVKLADELRELPKDDRSSRRIVDTMVLVNGLSRVLSVKETSTHELYSVVNFKDSLRDRYTNKTNQFIIVSKPSLKDAIIVLDEAFDASRDAMKTFDDIWLKSDHYSFDKNDARDHLINIMSYLRWSDNYNASDVLKFVWMLTQKKDDFAAMDRLVHCVADAASDNSKTDDFLTTIAEVGHIASLGGCDDHLKAEEIIYDNLDLVGDLDLVKDCIYELSDDLYNTDERNAMLCREIFALADCLTAKSLKLVVIDTSDTVDSVGLATTRSCINESTTVADVIRSIRNSLRMMESWSEYDDLRGKYHQNMHDLYNQNDLIASIVYISRISKSPSILKDMIKILMACYTATDYNEIVDDFASHLSDLVSHHLITFDMVKNSRYEAKLNDLNVWDDQVKAERIFYDIFEDLNIDLIEDIISKLDDRQYRTFAMTKLASTILHFADALFGCKLTITANSLATVDDDLSSGPQVTHIGSFTFFEDAITRWEETSEKDLWPSKDLLLGVDNCTDNDLHKFTEAMYRLAAVSKCTDPALFDDFIRMCNCMNLFLDSESTPFLDYLKSVFDSSLADRCGVNDFVGYVHYFAKYSDNLQFSDQVAQELIIFDDMNGLQTTLITDTIDYLADKFAELSKHQCRVILEHDLIICMEYLVEKKVTLHLSADNILIKDRFWSSQQSLAYTPGLFAEVITEIGKKYNATDNSFFNDLLKTTYTDRVLDNSSSNDSLIGIYTDTNYDQLSFSGVVFDYHIAYEGETLMRIRDQIRKIINIKYITSESIVSDVLYNKFGFAYSDATTLQDAITKLYDQYHLTDEINKLKDMLLQVRDASEIRILQTYIDDLREFFVEKHIEQFGMNDALTQLPATQKADSEQPLDDSIINTILNTPEMTMQTLHDILEGNMTGKPFDFAKFIDAYWCTLDDGADVDIARMISSIVISFDTMNANELHKMVDYLFTEYDSASRDNALMRDLLEGAILSINTDHFANEDEIPDSTTLGILREFGNFIERLYQRYVHNGYSITKMASELHSHLDSGYMADQNFSKEFLAAKNATRAKDLGGHKDTATYTFSDRFGETWGVKDSAYSTEQHFYKTDAFGASDMIRDLVMRSCVAEMHRIIDVLLVSYQAFMTDYHKIQDDLMMYGISDAHDMVVDKDQLTSIIVGKIYENQNYLDELIGKYVGALIDSQMLHDTIIRAKEFRELVGEHADYLDYFIKHETELTTDDNAHHVDGFVYQAEYDFLTSINAYLDTIHTIYTAYGFDYKSLQDALTVKGSRDIEQDLANAADAVAQKAIHSSCSEVLNYRDPMVVMYRRNVRDRGDVHDILTGKNADQKLQDVLTAEGRLIYAEISQARSILNGFDYLKEYSGIRGEDFDVFYTKMKAIRAVAMGDYDKQSVSDFITLATGYAASDIGFLSDALSYIYKGRLGEDTHITADMIRKSYGIVRIQTDLQLIAEYFKKCFGIDSISESIKLIESIKEVFSTKNIDKLGYFDIRIMGSMLYSLQTEISALDDRLMSVSMDASKDYLSYEEALKFLNGVAQQVDNQALQDTVSAHDENGASDVTTAKSCIIIKYIQGSTFDQSRMVDMILRESGMTNISSTIKNLDLVWFSDNEEYTEIIPVIDALTDGETVNKHNDISSITDQVKQIVTTYAKENLRYYDDITWMYAHFAVTMTRVKDDLKSEAYTVRKNDYYQFYEDLRHQESMSVEDADSMNDTLSGTHTGLSNDNLDLHDAITNYMINLWIGMDSVITKDALLRDNFHSVAKDLHKQVDLLKTQYHLYGVDKSALADSLSGHMTDGGSSSMETGDTVSGTSDSSEIDYQALYEKFLADGTPFPVSDDGTFMGDYLFASSVNAFSKEFYISYLLEKFSIKNIGMKSNEVHAMSELLSANGWTQQDFDYAKYKELLGWIADMLTISKDSTAITILDEICNQKMFMRMRDLLGKFKDSLKVNDNVKSIIRDELAEFDELYTETLQLINKNLTTLSNGSMQDSFTVARLSPSHIVDSPEYKDILSDSEESIDSKDNQVSQDSISTSTSGFSAEVSTVVDNIHIAKQKLRLISILSIYTDILTLKSETYKIEDVVNTFEKLARFDEEFTDPIEEGMMLADVLLGHDQLLSNNALVIRDGLYEFTPTGIRRVV